MDFDFSKEEKLTKKQQEIDTKLAEYEEKFGEMDTWDLDDEELLEILNKCLKENKSYEDIYGKIKYSRFIDY